MGDKKESKGEKEHFYDLTCGWLKDDEILMSFGQNLIYLNLSLI